MLMRPLLKFAKIEKPIIKNSKSQNQFIWTIASISLIIGLAIFRLYYIAYKCPWDLSTDETHYWCWSQHLDWCYYSKGPLVSWTIWLSTKLLGNWSIEHTGGLMFAVRAPAVIYGSLILIGIFRLGILFFKNGYHAFWVTVIAASLPSLQTGSILMTIDPPFLACWTWAIVFAYKATVLEENRSFYTTGLVIGIGILAKYTMILFLCSWILYLWTNPNKRRIIFSRHFAGMFCLIMMISSPLILWNCTHQYVTLEHLLTQLGFMGNSAKPGIHFLGPLRMLIGQFALYLGFWFLLFIYGCWQCNIYKSQNEDQLFLWWLTYPGFLLFFLISLKTEVQLNWPAAQFISGFILILLVLKKQTPKDLRNHRVNFPFQMPRRMVCWIIFGFCLGLISLDGRFLQKSLVDLIEPFCRFDPFPLRKIDPTCRLVGWRELGKKIDQINEQLFEKTGEKPVIIALNWTIASELSFYCRNNSEIYSCGRICGDRYSQFDLWKPNPIHDAQDFYGRTFIIVGHQLPDLQESFQTISKPRIVLAFAGENAVGGWTIWIGECFKGFPEKLLENSSDY